MDSSVHFRSRKRKQCSSSNPLNGTFTRSKSQIHVHRSRSGRAWQDIPVRKPSRQAQLLLGKPLAKPRNIPHPLPENGASLDLSIKDLRARARRVFSPASLVEEESGKFEVGFGLGEKGFTGDSNVLDNCKSLDLGITDSDLGVKSSDAGSDLGFAGSGKEEDGEREDEGPFSPDVDPVLCTGSHGQPDKEKDVNLNEKTPLMEKKDEGNEVESGKDCVENQRNGFISGSTSVLYSYSKRKVFKAPGSFSYRRLLPFLIEMAKNDSSTSKIEVVDVGYPCKVQNLNYVNSKLSSALTECYGSKHKYDNDQSDCTKALDERDYQNSGIQLPVIGQDLDDRAEKMAKTKGNLGLSDMEQRNHENGMNGVDEKIEEFVQTTPPDYTIFNKLDNDDAAASREINALQSGNRILEKPSNNFSQDICISVQSHPARKRNTIPNAKLVLNPCSRSKIYKTSSFSYRRLLPFLTDVAKSTSNIDQHPKFQGEGDSYSVSKETVDENVPVSRTRTDDFPGNQQVEDQEPLTGPVNPNKGSSDDISPNMSIPLFCSGDSFSNEKSNTASSEATIETDILDLERRSQNEQVTTDCTGKLEIELPTNDIKSCRSESNSSAETSCSPINHESLSRESNSEFSQVSEHEPIDIGKDCVALGLDYKKDKLQLIKSVSLNQSSLAIEEFDHQGDRNDSPTKGILKRNPRGCRGLCSCMTCSSFRLNAVRSFEFSKRQMLDTEEVAQGLIHELAELRSLLEKSAFDGNDLAAIQINQLQAKEACKRSLKTEQVAKSRLSQMNDDLNIHCRITPLQQPRVTFARYIEEIAIPKADLSASPDLWKQDDKTQ